MQKAMVVLSRTAVAWPLLHSTTTAREQKPTAVWGRWAGLGGLHGHTSSLA